MLLALRGMVVRQAAFEVGRESEGLLEVVKRMNGSGRKVGEVGAETGGR